MTLVVDASAAVEASLAESGFAHFGREKLHAPRLMWSEAASALHELLWRDSISRDLAERARERLRSAPVAPRSEVDLTLEAWSIAEELGWAKTYDAEYVALARLLGCRLVTADARLRRGAARLVEIIGPAEV